MSLALGGSMKEIPTLDQEGSRMPATSCFCCNNTHGWQVKALLDTQLCMSAWKHPFLKL